MINSAQTELKQVKRVQFSWQKGGKSRKGVRIGNTLEFRGELLGLEQIHRDLLEIDLVHPAHSVLAIMKKIKQREIKGTR